MRAWPLLSLVLVGCPASPPAASRPTAVAPRAPASAAAEEIPEVAEHRRLVGQNPDGLTFTISLPDGTRFRQGERISVELAFSSSLPDTFKLNGALYDRSGRLKVDEYRVFPAGTSDPLADYFGTETGFAGGGLRTMPVLGREPKRLRFDLNEWQRFDEPGHYQLYVVSQRLRWEHRDAADAGIQSHAVTSQNIVSFDVVPAEHAWQERTRKAALSVLDADKSSEDDQREAVRTLRFLDTEAAARAMVSRLHREQLGYSLSFALYAMRHRGAAIQELEARLARPDTPFTSVMLTTLVMLRLWHEDPPGTRHSQQHWSRIRDDVVKQLVQALPKKQLAARALCVDALLGVGGQLSPEQQASVLREVPEVLPALPTERLDELLRYRFLPLKKLPLAEPLKQVLARSDISPELRQIALERWLVFSPAGARTMMLDVIERGTPDLGRQAMDTLTLLPDKTLKEVDGAVVGRLERCAPRCDPQAQPLSAALIQRFASARSAARLRRVYPTLTFYDDRSDAAFIAYFLRVDPTFGKQALARRLRDKPPGSAVTLLSEIARLGFPKQAEPELIATLGAKRVFDVTVAARELSRYGSKAAERALYQRLSVWSKKWRGREQELERPLIGHTEGGDEASLEGELWRAIVQGRGWLTDRAGFEKLRTLLLRDSEKQQLDTPMQEWKRGALTLRWTRTDADELRVKLAQYELESRAEVEQKLAQFPRGTRFEWRPYDDVPGELERVRKIVAKYGHTLTRP